MKWKDTGDMTENEETNKEEYFDEEQYSPWATPNGSSKGGKLKRIPIVFILLGLAIIASVAALLMFLLSPRGDTITREQAAAFERRLQQLEERLDKYEAIDEKVARIWDQARSYEKFKDRFDRSEASMSLRMDHLTMSLETLQKQISAVSKTAPPTPSASPVKAVSTETEATPATQPAQYHIVSAGDTFFNISKRYGLSVDELLKLNHMEKDSVLQIGQKIIVRENSEAKD